MRRALAVVLVALVPPLLACSGVIDPAALEEAMRPEPPPSEAWVGTWEGPGMTIRIDPTGLVDLRQASIASGEVASSIAGPAKAWSPSIEVGVGVFTTGWRVDEAPHEVDGQWRMVIEGVVVVRTSTDAGLAGEPVPFEAPGLPPEAPAAEPVPEGAPAEGAVAPTPEAAPAPEAAEPTPTAEPTPAEAAPTP